MATRKFLVNIDLDQNSLINTVIENRDSVIDGYPSTPVAGQIFYDENASNKKPFYYDGTTWVAMSSATASSVPFSGVTTGTNTTATMTVGTGASLTVSGSGTINANRYNSNTIIALADGGTNANLTAVNGGILYSTASDLAILSAGVSGQLLQSGGSGAPSWISVASLSIDHGGLTGLSDDDHTQYIHTVPGSSRNIIAPTTADVVPLTVKQSSGSFSLAHNVFTVQTNGGTDILNLYRSATSTYVLRLNTNAGPGTVGYIKMDSFSGRTTGSIDTSASASANGGSIVLYGNATGSPGGLIALYGGGTSGAAGGSIFANGNTSRGGSIYLTGSTVSSVAYPGNIDLSSNGSRNAGSIVAYSGVDDVSPGGQGGNIYTYGSDSGSGGSSVAGGDGGDIFTFGGTGGDELNNYGGNGGSILTYGGDGLSGSPGDENAYGGNGGSIQTYGASGYSDGEPGGNGGSILTYANQTNNGGSISTYAGTQPGGSINTSNGGGSIDTTGNGSIQFGIVANRITVQGTASSGGRTYTLPNVGADTFFVMSAGTQNITGSKTFSGSSLLLGGAGVGVATFTYANSANSRTITFPDAGGNKSVCIATESTTTTQALFASATTGQPEFRAIVSGDLPSLTGTYLRVVPAATSDNTVAPTASGVVGLVVKQTTTSPAKVFEVQTSGGSPIFTVGDSGGNTDVTVATNLTVTGNLTINGTTTTVNTSTLLVEDNFITVNSIAASIDAGIEVERAGVSCSNEGRTEIRNT
jgi:hypothetical protein